MLYFWIYLIISFLWFVFVTAIVSSDAYERRCAEIGAELQSFKQAGMVVAYAAPFWPLIVLQISVKSAYKVLRGMP